jgi:carboxylesterase
VISSAFPATYQGGDTAVLLIHGFTGFPGDMTYLAEQLHREGYTVRVPRLPGHGTDGGDFLSSGWKDWLRCSVDEYLELASRYQVVHIGGLSMGGVLAVILAATFPIKKVALYAPALRVRNRFIPLSGVYGLLFKRVRSGAHEYYQEPEMEYLSAEYWDYLWPSQSWGLFRLMRKAVRRLRRIEGEVLTIVSEADETVPTGVAKLVESKVEASRRRTVILTKSGHVVTRDTEAERVAQETIRFFQTP